MRPRWAISGDENSLQYGNTQGEHRHRLELEASKVKARTGGSDVQQRSFRVATSAARSSVGLIRVVLFPDGSEPRDEECAATISRHEAAVLLRQPFQVHKPPLLLLDGCHVREREAWAHVGAVLGNGRQMQWNGALERASLRFETAARTVDCEEGEARVVEHEDFGGGFVGWPEKHVRAEAAVLGEAGGHLLCKEADVLPLAGLRAAEAVVSEDAPVQP